MNLKAISSDSGIQDLARTIAKRFDADGNGQLSMTEFADVMKTLLGGSSSAPTFPTSPSSATSLSTTSSEARVPKGTLAGYDPTKLANPDHNTLKYQVGRILQYYPSTPQGLRDALPEIQQLVPGVRITGTNGDKLDFGTYVDPKAGRIGVIDVLQGASQGGRAWQWGVVE
jgi:hypothetical protein